MVMALPFTGEKSVRLNIFPNSDSDFLTLIDEGEAQENGEAQIQLQEGCSYHYEISDDYQLDPVPGLIQPFSDLISNSGLLTPGIYTGTLVLVLSHKTNNESSGTYKVEVRSRKTDYRSEYRFMLEEIAEQCIDLILKHSSPVVQNIAPNYDLEPKTLYQKYAFISSFIGSEEFQESVNRIINAPVTKWKFIEKEIDIQNVGRIKNQTVRQIVSSSKRIPIPDDNPFAFQFDSLPRRITSNEKRDSLDTPENQFIKYVLTEYYVICSDISQKLITGSREKQESELLSERLRGILDHPIFKGISDPLFLNINSPVLQRKEGYREIYRTWLMFDIAAKLIWTGGDDVYSAGKKDVALLYEYWVYFKLMNIVGSIFSLEPESFEKLIVKTKDDLNLRLKSGKCTSIRGICNYNSRNLEIELSYNRTFAGSDDDNYPDKGSWTRSMRPDYTLSIWPSEFSVEEAENQELIVHIHFDAKYRVENLRENFGPDFSSSGGELESIHDEEERGVYKRIDLLKMHAYKDAIRRTAGAYVLYPGTENKKWRGFHEIIPGLGAFTIRPDKTDDGSYELENFIREAANHLLNRASQHERITYHIHETFTTPQIEVREVLPEFVDGMRTKPPSELFVLIGFSKSAAHRIWIEQNGLYNVRIEGNQGENIQQISPEEAASSFLLLHQSNELISGDLWRINDGGPIVYSKSELLNRGYPDPTSEYYLVYNIEPVIEEAFMNNMWDIRKLDAYKGGRRSAWPFAVPLSELMKVKVK